MIGYYKVAYIKILIFFAFVAITILIAIRIEPDEYEMAYGVVKKIEHVSKLDSVDFYIAEEQKPVIYMNSKNADIHNNDKLNMILPNGYSVIGDEKVFYKSDIGKAVLSKETMYLSGDVEFTKGETKYKSKTTSYNFKSGNMTSVGRIYLKDYLPDTKDTITIYADENDGNMFRKVSNFKGNIKGRLQRFRPYEEGFNFTSNVMKLDANNKVIYFNDDLNFNRANMKIQAQRGEVYLDNYNKKLKYYVLYDDINLEEKVKSRGKSFVRKAVSQKLEGLDSGNRIVLSGAPVVTQEGDVIKGNEIVLRRNVELIEVEDSSTTFKVKNRN